MCFTQNSCICYNLGFTGKSYFFKMKGNLGRNRIFKYRTNIVF